MRPLDVAAVLEAFAADPASSGLFLDLDGTLAPIVTDPSSVRLPPALSPLLVQLARRLGLVAIVSGRPAGFLGERACVKGVRLLGLYGMEEWRDGRTVARPEAARWQDTVDRARSRLVEELDGLPGLIVEDKGLSVAVHWRNAGDRAAAGSAVGDVVGRIVDSTGLALEPGKFVAELRPPVAWDKGRAVRALAEEAELSRVAYVGDDLGDLPAFAAVRASGGWALAVDQGVETPPGLLEAADAILDGHEAVARFLAELCERVSGTPRAT